MATPSPCKIPATRMQCHKVCIRIHKYDIYAVGCQRRPAKTIRTHHKTLDLKANKRCTRLFGNELTEAYRKWQIIIKRFTNFHWSNRYLLR